MERGIASNQAIENRNRALGQLLIIALLIGGAYAGWQMYSSQAATTFGALESFTCGQSTVDDEDGNTYDTILIGSQCWMQQNMRVGTTSSQTDNGIIEKSCYDNTATNCTENHPNYPDGGLYHWNEAMQYSTTSGAQGICPAEWHIPTDDEFKTLEMYLGMGQVQADGTGWRGTDEGAKLKANGSSGWEGNLTGRFDTFSYDLRNTNGLFWTSTEENVSQAWIRYLWSSGSQVHRTGFPKTSQRFAVRCLKDDPNPPAPTVTVGSTPTLASDDPLNDGLIGHWTFDGMDVDWASSTAEIRDASISGDHGNATTTMSPASVTQGKLGQALYFAGDDEDVFLSNNWNRIPNDSTIAFWFKKDSPLGTLNGMLGTYAGVAGNSIAINISGLDVIDYKLRDIGDVESVSAIEPGRWYHFAVTKKTTGDIRLYLDGELDVASTSIAGSYPLTNNNDLRIGFNGYTTNDSLIGSMDDVRIYDRALSVDEVSRLYRIGEGTKTHNTLSIPNLEQGLVGHWTFDGMDVDWANSTAEVEDVSGQGNHGDTQNGINQDSVTPGVLGQAVGFDGTEQIELGNNAKISNSATGSIAMWVKVDNTPSTAFGYGDSAGNDRLYFKILGSGKISFSGVDSLLSPSTVTLESASGIQLGEWAHIVVQSTGSSIEMFIDGESVNVVGANNDGRWFADIDTNATDNTYLGVEYLSGIMWDKFDGVMDDVRIYDRGLSDSEVQQLYNLGR